MILLCVVKLVATVKLLVDTAAKERLLATMVRVNEACAWLVERAFALQTADKIRLQKLYYRELRDRFGLSAQHVVRLLSKVCEAYKRDRSKLPRFKPHGAIPYDQRLYSFKNGLDRVSLLALDGRVVVPCAIGEYHCARLKGVRGQADLVYRNGKLFLFVTVEVPDGSPVEPTEFLGVDLGIRNLATDSDGACHSGNAVEAMRVRILDLRTALQFCGTKSAKRHLKRLANLEARFRAHTNHVLSKGLVAKAQDTARGIALEDLKGIRDRVTVQKSQRARHGGWSFHQLRAFVTYKCQLAGVRLVLVDPRNTSRTCPECEYCDKANRRSQSEFVCKSCGFAQHADVVGARNIARRADVIRPTVPVVEAGNRDPHRMPRRDQEQDLSLAPVGTGRG